ncbi:hypothetical protein CRG98_025994 [Punica granatum]|uniref:Uncharacterized protein n=1 Tax=Punica granatum TaxID=22663 RepID=A0A2I0JD86_PUNGR|nr:hypothetical protein CRG98_025994 [Punica granatum]
MGGPEAWKPTLLDLDYWSKINRFCCPFACLHVVLLALGGIVGSSTLAEVKNQRHPGSAIGAFSVFLECSDVSGDHCVLRLLKMSPEGCGQGGCCCSLFELYGPECGLSSGPASRAFGSRCLGASTFPWERVTDTRVKESPLIILRSEGRGRISYPGLGVWNA